MNWLRETFFRLCYSSRLVHNFHNYHNFIYDSFSSIQPCPLNNLIYQWRSLFDSLHQTLNNLIYPNINNQWRSLFDSLHQTLNNLIYPNINNQWRSLFDSLHQTLNNLIYNHLSIINGDLFSIHSTKPDYPITSWMDIYISRNQDGDLFSIHYSSTENSPSTNPEQLLEFWHMSFTAVAKQS